MSIVTKEILDKAMQAAFHGGTRTRDQMRAALEAVAGDLVRAEQHETMEQAKLNGMGAERELALMARVRKLEMALEGIDVVATRHKKGAIGVAQKIARAALSQIDAATKEGSEWRDLCGVAPNATGDKTSEQFIRDMRDEWQNYNPAPSGSVSDKEIV